MKNLLIVVLLAIIVWIMLGMPMPDIERNQYEFESSPATVIYHTPVYDVQPPTPIQPTGEPMIVIIPVIQSTDTPEFVPTNAPVATSTVEYNPVTAQDYGLPNVGPLSALQLETCRNLFDSHLENTMKREQRQVCEYHLR